MSGTAREREIALPLKRVLAHALSSTPVGRAVEFFTRDRISNNGIMFDTSLPTFSPSVKAAMRFGIHESAEIRFIRRHLDPDVDVVELGSGLGVTSAHILDILSPGRSLTCVDANPDLLPALRHTLDQAQTRRNLEVRVVHGAISAAAGDDHRQTVGFMVTCSGLDSTVVQTDWERPHTMAVPRVTLSALVADSKEYSLVIDIEGAEVFLLHDDTAALRNARQIVIELHPTRYAGRPVSVTEMSNRLLNDLGFKLLDQRGPVLACSR